MKNITLISPLKLFIAFVMISMVQITSCKKEFYIKDNQSMKIVTLSELKRLTANLPLGNVAKSSNKISGNNMIYWKNAYSIQLKNGNNIIHVPLVELI